MHDDWVYTWLCNMCLPPTLLQHWHITCLMWGKKGENPVFGAGHLVQWLLPIGMFASPVGMTAWIWFLVHPLLCTSRGSRSLTPMWQSQTEFPSPGYLRTEPADGVSVSFSNISWVLSFVIQSMVCIAVPGLFLLTSSRPLQAPPGPSRLLWMTALPPSFWLNGTRFCVYPTFLSPPVRWWIPELIPCLRSRELALCCSGIPHGCCECSPSSVPCSWLSFAPIFVEGIFLDHSYGWSVLSSSNSTSSSSVFWIPWFCMSCHSPITCPLFGHI